MSKKKKTYIKCKWQDQGRILVNPDGQVYPCCYLCNKAFRTENQGTYGPANQVEDMDAKPDLEKVWDKNSPGNAYWKLRRNNHPEYGFGDQVMIDYKKHYDELNLKKNSMKNILNHKWFTEILPKSWEKEETRLDACRQFCENVEDE